MVNRKWSIVNGQWSIVIHHSIFGLLFHNMEINSTFIFINHW